MNPRDLVTWGDYFNTMALSHARDIAEAEAWWRHARLGAPLGAYLVVTEGLVRMRRELRAYEENVAAACAPWFVVPQ